MKPSELLADPASWTQHNAARASDGDCVLSLSRDACCWCMFGAFIKVYVDSIGYSGASKKRMQAEHKAALLGSIPMPGCFSEWQDEPGRTHAEVIAVLQAVGE